MESIRVIELFAGVGGFRIGLEKASDIYKFVWSNQWEPSTKKQDASDIYRKAFGDEGHSNEDISCVATESIPECDLVTAGFPCQDYSVASNLKNSHGIYGKKGVLWWQICRILEESEKRPEYLFFENVDRLLKSPASQRGRDFAIILASLSDLGYAVEWRVINAADYGMPQRRRRTYILGYLKGSKICNSIEFPDLWVCKDGVFAKAFPIEESGITEASRFIINGRLDKISKDFNKNWHSCVFGNSSFMSDRCVFTARTQPLYNGVRTTLGDILEKDADVPETFFIQDSDVPKWETAKGSKKFDRVSPDGHKYVYSEGAMPFPDKTDTPSRTIITGEGGASPSRFKHVVKGDSGRYRRLTPVELERLNMFPDNHTDRISDVKRAFMMGNALVTGS